MIISAQTSSIAELQTKLNDEKSRVLWLEKQARWLGSGKDRGLGLRVDLVNRLGPLSQPSVFWVQPFQVMDIPTGKDRDDSR